MRLALRERLFAAFEAFCHPEPEPPLPVVMQLGSRLIDLRKLAPSDVTIEDIAHALSNQCRWNGWPAEFYSVAQHSVEVSLRVAPEHALAGLLHDASEAYLGDMPTPIKRVMPTYQELEHHVQSMCMRAFLLPDILHSEIKVADGRTLATEARDILTHPPLWTLAYDAYPERTPRALTPPEAAEQFIHRFRHLWNDEQKRRAARGVELETWSERIGEGMRPVLVGLPGGRA